MLDPNAKVGDTIQYGINRYMLLEIGPNNLKVIKESDGKHYELWRNGPGKITVVN